ncbi:MAG: DNA polymerase III subunit beta [Patescibacteria group bacterium]
MKFSCTQENLNHGLNVVNHVASKNANLPILANVLIEVDKTGIKLSTTNLEVGVSSTVRGKIEEPGKLTVPARLFADYVSLLPNEKVDFESEENDLKVSCQKSHTKIKGMQADEFPVIPQVDKKDKCQIKAKDFKASIASVIFAVAYDESRPEISGVFTQFKDKEMTLVATDSYRLAEKKVQLSDGSKKEQGVIVPVRTYQELMRVLESEEDILEINLNENQIQFSLGDVELVSRVIDGQYPDYQQIIPAEQRTTAVVNLPEFVKAIKTASLFCKSGINDINLNFEKDKIKIHTSNTQIGENESEVEAKIQGDNNQIVFNYRYLLDGLANLDGEETEIRLIDSVNPGLLVPPGQSDYLYIIMPIKQ